MWFYSSTALLLSDSFSSFLLHIIVEAVSELCVCACVPFHHISLIKNVKFGFIDHWEMFKTYSRRR